MIYIKCAYDIRGIIYTAQKNIRKYQQLKRDLKDIPFLTKKYDQEIIKHKNTIKEMLKVAKENNINLDI